MLNELIKKIDRLKKLYETVNSEKQQVLIEKAELANIIKQKDEKIKEFERNIEILQLAKAFDILSNDKQEAKQKIGRIVREIEKCIAMLNN
jgi:tRNA U34 5-carboxymethylaminomethyl modifying GTPase MnmE/TrmE